MTEMRLAWVALWCYQFLFWLQNVPIAFGIKINVWVFRGMDRYQRWNMAKYYELQPKVHTLTLSMQSAFNKQPRDYSLWTSYVIEAESYKVRLQALKNRQLILLPHLVSMSCETLKEANDKLRLQNESFATLIEGLGKNPNFSCDLLLWFIMPGACAEQAFGDLMEEYEVKAATLGADRARSWYRAQTCRETFSFVMRGLKTLWHIFGIVELLERLITRRKG